MATMPTVFTDDADGFAAWDVTDQDGQNVDWASPQIRLTGPNGSVAYSTAAFQGSPAPTREIRLSMPNALSLAPGVYDADLKVPNGNDFTLGGVHVRTRS